MGMYTELVLGVELKPKPPQQVVDVLHFMANGTEQPPLLPSHPLFSTYRWDFMLRSDSYYFDGDTQTTFRFDDIANAWMLTARSNLKNYDGEIALFLDWLAPFCRTQGFVGHWRYEEDDDPTLIYFDNGTVHARCLTELLAAADGVDPLRAAIPSIRADLKAANMALDAGQYVTVGYDLLAIESRLALLAPVCEGL